MYALMIIKGNIDVKGTLELLERRFKSCYKTDITSLRYIDHQGQTDQSFTVWGDGQQVSASIKGANVLTRKGLGLSPGELDPHKLTLNAKTLSMIELEIEIVGSDGMFQEIYQVLADAYPQHVLVSDYE